MYYTGCHVRTWYWEELLEPAPACAAHDDPAGLTSMLTAVNVVRDSTKFSVRAVFRASAPPTPPLSLDAIALDEM
eukprot:SAG31_NODE_3272_length_4477_cov_1.981270_2_plen_75_part_00